MLHCGIPEGGWSWHSTASPFAFQTLGTTQSFIVPLPSVMESLDADSTRQTSQLSLVWKGCLVSYPFACPLCLILAPCALDPNTPAFQRRCLASCQYLSTYQHYFGVCLSPHTPFQFDDLFLAQHTTISILIFPIAPLPRRATLPHQLSATIPPGPWTARDSPSCSKVV